MKKLAGFFAALALLLQVGGALAQTSDYEIISSYKQQQQALLESIKSAKDPRETAALEGEIGRLEAQYAPHRSLLAEGLYPETFGTSIAALRDQLKKAAERISLAEENRESKAKIETISRKAEQDSKTIEEISRQNAEYRTSIERLNQEIADLGVRIQALTDENAGLLEKIAGLQAESRKDKATIAKLQELTEKLNANIRDRDELIVKMMDSMFNEYAKPGMSDEQRKNLFVNIQGKDYVGKIVTTLDGNVKYAESTVMSPQDLALIRGEERKLASKWNEIKPFVGKLYPDEQARVRDLATVDGRLADWKQRIGEATWKSIHQVFVGQNVDIGSFRSADEFQARLLAYVDEQTKNPSRGSTAPFASTAVTAYSVSTPKRRWPLIGRRSDDPAPGTLPSRETARG